jgi:hypothetical protein
MELDGRVFVAPLRQLSQQANREVRPLIVMAVEAGFRSGEGLARTTNTTLRLLFPGGHAGYLDRFDLSRKADRQHVRERIMPAALANREAVVANPKVLEQVVFDHWRGRSAQRLEVVRTGRLAEAVAVLPDHEARIIIHGCDIWPRVDDQFTYDFDQARVAAWFFRDQCAWLEMSSIAATAAARAIYVRNSVKWLAEYLRRVREPNAAQVIRLVVRFAGLMERDPDARSVFPPSPKIEGAW